MKARPRGGLALTLHPLMQPDCFFAEARGQAARRKFKKIAEVFKSQKIERPRPLADLLFELLVDVKGRGIIEKRRQRKRLHFFDRRMPRKRKRLAGRGAESGAPAEA